MFKTLQVRVRASQAWLLSRQLRSPAQRRSEVVTLWVHDQKQLDRSVMDNSAIRILNVIDDQATRTLVTRALEHYDMSVTSSDRQRLARHLHQDKFDLIILDIRQRRGEKLLLLRQILSASIPVIVTDGHRCSAGDRAAAMELGADDCISEPIAPRELVARVRAILRRRGRARVAAASGSDRGGSVSPI
jgi:DNA-binding response OmpR family regulator